MVVHVQVCFLPFLQSDYEFTMMHMYLCSRHIDYIHFCIFVLWCYQKSMQYF